MISPDEVEALCRTARLIRLDVFDTGPESEADIVAGLRATTVRIVTDRSVAATPGGQTAIVTLFAQLAMTGLQVDLDVPNVELVVPQPPLEGGRLVDALVVYSDDLIPGGSSRGSARPDLVVTLGDLFAPDAGVRITWSDDAALVVPGSEPVEMPSGHNLPFGAIAAGAMGATEGVRAAMPAIAARLDLPLPENSRWTSPGTRRMQAAFGSLLEGFGADVGSVDVVSGGAITNALLYCLLRVPNVRGAMRIIEHDVLDMSNLNRYPLATRSQVGARKVDVLTSYSTEQFTFVGEPYRLQTETIRSLEPLGPKVLVGVDDIPSRWLTQVLALDGTICVAATSHDYVLVTTHLPGTPCAGCVHPRDDWSLEPIPTIGFVSLWAGLMQAVQFLAPPETDARATEVWPLGLENPRGIRRYAPTAHPQCPVYCAASTRGSSSS